MIENVSILLLLYMVGMLIPIMIGLINRNTSTRDKWFVVIIYLCSVFLVVFPFSFQYIGSYLFLSIHLIAIIYIVYFDQVKMKYLLFGVSVAGSVTYLLFLI